MRINDELVIDPKTEVKILYELAKTNKPMYLYQISKKAKLSPQLTNHTIKKLFDKGLILKIEGEKPYYYTHPCFSKGKQEILNNFKKLIEVIYNYINETNNKEFTLKNCIEMFLMMFVIDVNGD
jgi:predicted transcriptional regulator